MGWVMGHGSGAAHPSTCQTGVARGGGTSNVSPGDPVGLGCQQVASGKESIGVRP